MLIQIVALILGTLGDLLSLAFLLRLWLQFTRSPTRHALGQAVQIFTDWAVLPLRRVLPGYAGIDWASLLPAYLMQLGYFALIAVLSGLTLGPAVALWAWVGLLKLFVWLLIGCIVLAALLSWLQPWSPWRALAESLSRPLLAPLRRIIPPIGGIDLTPLAVILLLQVALIVLASLGR